MAEKTLFKKNEVRKMLAAYKKQLHAEGVPVRSLYLFGSYAKETPRPWSDIDVAVVAPQFRHASLEERARMNHIAHRVHDFIEAHPIPPAALKEKYSPIGAAIREHGVKV